MNMRTHQHSDVGSWIDRIVLRCGMAWLLIVRASRLYVKHRCASRGVNHLPVRPIRTQTCPRPPPPQILHTIIYLPYLLYRLYCLYFWHARGHTHTRHRTARSTTPHTATHTHFAVLSISHTVTHIHITVLHELYCLYTITPTHLPVLLAEVRAAVGPQCSAACHQLVTRS